VWRDRIVQIAACAGIAQVLLVWLPAVPLGVPGEWTWWRIPYSDGNAAILFIGSLVAVPVGIAYVALCRLGDPGRGGAETVRRIGLRLLALVIAGFAWLWVVQEAGPRDYDRLGRAPVVLFYPGFSGYFTEARKIDDLAAYLASYESLMAEGDVLHLGTHPPGLIVGQRLLLDLFESSPQLTKFALALRPESARAATEVVVESESIGGSQGRAGGPPTAAEQAELWTAAVLVQIAAAAAVIPLYHVASRSASPAAAWRTACLWPLVPAVAVFLPKADALLPLIGLSALALWYRPSPPGPLRAAAAAAVFWLGMTVSLAMLPVAALAGLLSVQQILWETPALRRKAFVATLLAACAAMAAFLTLTLLVWLAFDLNLFSVWSWNYRNHAAFYAQYDRTYWRWLFVNPVELAVGVGAPIAVAAAASLRQTAGTRLVPIAVFGVIALLWLSGKNSGETARLWLFLMPWLLWAAAPVWSGEAARSRWSAILLIQVAVGFATAVRVSGFGFDELAGIAG
jgi:hypothetical protein